MKVTRFAKRRAWAASLSVAVLVPLFAAGLVWSSGLAVTVQLEGVYYDSVGNAVTEVVLPATTAKVLRRWPGLAGNGTAHGEVVRPGKSVRLGGYFYSTGDWSVDRCVEWLGTHVDVYSLGMCGSVFSPGDVLDVKALNPRVRFYYMAFATTLFENRSGDPPMSWGTWGDSHYPQVQFNDTMREWTLKLADGSEAIGVRRKSDDDVAHLMDLGDAGWADYFAAIYGARVEQFHADGVFVDEVMWRGYWGVDSSELRDYSSTADVTASCYDWLARVRSRLDCEFVTQAFWDEAQEYQDGVWGEIAFRAGGQYGDRVDDVNRSVWYEKMDWKGIVDNAAKHAALNRTYVWAAWYPRDDEGALEYAVATYLMAKPNGAEYLAFHPQPVFDGGYGDAGNLAGYSVETAAAEVAAHPEFFELELGDALGAPRLVDAGGGKVWIREFQNGLVLVNPFRARVPGLG
ncbi:MAG: hypothetical protein Kow0069_39210 [Promethearchaeota archaeon]